MQFNLCHYFTTLIIMGNEILCILLNYILGIILILLLLIFIFSNISLYTETLVLIFYLEPMTYNRLFRNISSFIKKKKVYYNIFKINHLCCWVIYLNPKYWRNIWTACPVMSVCYVLELGWHQRSRNYTGLLLLVLIVFTLSYINTEVE